MPMHLHIFLSRIFAPLFQYLEVFICFVFWATGHLVKALAINYESLQISVSDFLYFYRLDNQEYYPKNYLEG